MGRDERLRRAADSLRRKAGAMLDWPLGETDEDGQTVKPAHWSMRDAAQLYQVSFDLENSEQSAIQLAFGLELVKAEEWRRPEHLVDIGVSGWQELYHELCRQGWRWQKAAFMAWRAAPRRYRKPRTQEELAKLLGYAGDKVFRIWLKKPEQGPLMLQVIGQARQIIFELNLADVDHVTIERAVSVDSTVAERKLFYDLLERLHSQAGEPDLSDDYSDLSDEELDSEIERLDQIAA